MRDRREGLLRTYRGQRHEYAQELSWKNGDDAVIIMIVNNNMMHVP